MDTVQYMEVCLGEPLIYSDADQASKEIWNIYRSSWSVDY